MEIKLDKTTKILLGLIALGLFLNASNVWLDKAYANPNQVYKVALCNELGIACADVIKVEDESALYSVRAKWKMILTR
jgi:hypothetical protein